MQRNNEALVMHTPVSEDWIHREAIVNGIRLHYVEAGDGPLVLLLHGFPVFWYNWHHQIPALVRAGFRVVAPDMRGYNLSEKPPGVDSYTMDTLVGDVVGLIRHLGAERATLVGHDWGGGVAWNVPMRFPEMVEKLIAINSPHPVRLLEALRQPSQLVRSSYMFFFQLPSLPELVLRAGNFALLDYAFRHDPVHPRVFSVPEIARYKAALAQPGALTGALNYYRAAARRVRQVAGNSKTLAPGGHRRGQIMCPTMVLWGEQDRYFDLEVTRGMERLVAHLEVVLVRDASHWVHNEAPHEINTLMIDFLKRG